MGAELSDKKWITNQLLRESNLPVPEQRVVNRKRGAIRAAETLGYPVVVKPAAADYGNGVTVGIDSADEVATAFELARQFSKAVIVETFIHGNDYRLLVIDGNFVVAARRTRDILRNCYYILAFELICAAQAAEIRGLEALSTTTRASTSSAPR